jgi:iron-sulfur cluster assembly protein
MVTVTQEAAEMIKKSAEENDFKNMPLRIAVAAGCHGLQYRLGFDEAGADDAKFESNGIAVVVATESVPLITGLELDFITDEDGAAFTFKNPNAAPAVEKGHGHGHGSGGCSCGGGGNC